MWYRSDGNYELTRVEAGRYIFLSDRPSGGEIHLSKNLGLAFVRKGDRWMRFDSPLDVGWPLAVGNAGSTRVQWTSTWNPTMTARDRDVVWDVTWTVEGVEDVDVCCASAQLKAFRVLFRFDTRGGPPGGVDFTTWYAPEARQFLRGRGHPWLSLINFFITKVPLSPDGPLRAQIASPVEGLQASDQAILLDGEVVGRDGVTQVIVNLNEQEVHRIDLARAPRPRVNVTIPLMLKDGANVIRVTARDALGATCEERRSIVYCGYRTIVNTRIVPS